LNYQKGIQASNCGLKAILGERISLTAKAIKEARALRLHSGVAAFAQFDDEQLGSLGRLIAMLSGDGLCSYLLCSERNVMRARPYHKLAEIKKEKISGNLSQTPPSFSSVRKSATLRA
jgi:hypothetical protein